MNRMIGDGSLDSLNSEIELTGLQGLATAGLVISGTWSGTMTIQGSIDGEIVDNMVVQSMGRGINVTTITSNGQYFMNCSGLEVIKLKMASFNSGSANIKAYGTPAALFSRGINLLAATDGTLIGNEGTRLLVQSETARSYKRLTGNDSQLCKTGSGRCYGIIIGNNTTGGVVTLYDNSEASGSIISQLLAATGAAGAQFIPAELNFSNGLYAVTSGSILNDVTVIYR